MGNPSSRLRTGAEYMLAQTALVGARRYIIAGKSSQFTPIDPIWLNMGYNHPSVVVRLISPATADPPPRPYAPKDGDLSFDQREFSSKIRHISEKLSDGKSTLLGEHRGPILKGVNLSPIRTQHREIVARELYQ